MSVEEARASLDPAEDEFAEVARAQGASLARRRLEAQERGVPSPPDAGRLSGALVHVESGLVIQRVIGMNPDALPEGTAINTKTRAKAVENFPFGPSED